MSLSTVLAAAVALGASSGAFAERVEFGELKVLVEINATDGDVGFHALADADAWWHLRADGPGGRKLLNIRAFDTLRLQGLTENFFESAEPLCSPDPEEPDELVVSLAEFLERFPAGDYTFRATMENGDRAVGTAALTHALPAAPDITLTEDMQFPIDGVVLLWEPGDDFGESWSDESLIASGAIPDPAAVELVGWEVVVEVDDDELPERVFSAQLPPESTSVTVPVEYLQPFVDLGVEAFKFEIGAIEASGNQTFSEGSFEVF